MNTFFKLLFVLLNCFISNYILGQNYDERFDKVHNYATTEYKPYKITYLIERLSDPLENNTTRGYAEMGISNHFRFLNETIKKAILDTLYKSIKYEKNKIPTSILSLFIKLGGQPQFILEQLGRDFNNHPFELEFLKSYNDKEYVKKRLKTIAKITKPLEEDPEQMTRYVSVGMELFKLCEKEGLEMLIPILSQENYSCSQCRHNLFKAIEPKLEQAMDTNFNYKSINYSPRFDSVANAINIWWKRNRNMVEICPKPKIIYANKEAYPIAIGFGSHCCGVPSDENIVLFINEFKKRNQISKIQAFDDDISHFDEGEYTLLFSLKELSQTQKKDFIKELKNVIQHYKPENESGGYFRINENVTLGNKNMGKIVTF